METWQIPRQTAKNQLAVAFSFDQHQVQPGSHVIYWANAADYLGGAVSVRRSRFELLFITRRRIDSTKRSYRTGHSIRWGMSGIAYLIYRGFHASATFC
jgi:hypothetical protein